jgi:predicted aminopeptidase
VKENNISQNAHGLLNKWWNEQHLIARQSGSEYPIAIERAEARMAVISELRDLCNKDAIVPRDQVHKVWQRICEIAKVRQNYAALSNTVWQPRSPHVRLLAEFINAFRE